MSNVLRSTTFQLEFNGADGLTGIRTFSKAVKDADATVAELNAQLGQNATVTYKTVQSKKELAQQARLIANQMERNNKITDAVTEQYKNMAAMVNKTADEIEQLNAVQRLGSNATDAQKQQVLQAVQQYQQLRGAADDASGSFRDLRGTAQNFGWQMQDTIVQLQMGTSGFVVFSQQASQFVSAFGPGGAFLGAVIALGGVLAGSVYTAMNSVAGATDRLTKHNEALGQVLSRNEQGIVSYTDKIKQLAKQSSAAANTQITAELVRANQVVKDSGLSLVKYIDTMSGAGVALYDTTDAIKQLGSVIKTSSGYLYTGIGTGDTFRETVKELGETFGLTGKSAETLGIDILKMIDSMSKTRDPQALSDIRDNLLKLAQNANLSEEKLTEFVTTVNDISTGAIEAADAIKKLSQGFDPLEESKKKTDELIRSNAVLNEEITRGEIAAAKLSAAYELGYTSVEQLSDGLSRQIEEQYRLNQLKEKSVNVNDQIVKAFEEEYNSLVKQTESTQQEYDRRKAIIDDYVAEFGNSNEKVKKAYEDLNRWKINEENKEFNNFYNNLIKKTNAVDQEYDRQKAIIDNFIVTTSADEQRKTNAYIALEKWKTDEIGKEFDRRAKIQRQIERAQVKSLGGDEAKTAEMEQYNNNMRQLREMMGVKDLELSERQRIGLLIENETARHNAVMDDLNLQSYQTQLATYSMAVNQMTGLVDMMTNGVEQVKSQTANMNAFQKTMFVMSQALAIAMALVNGQIIGMQLAKNASFLDFTGLSSAAAYTVGISMGAASAGAIAGVTLAGAFDEGGNVPAGQFGIVSEYGDELVNGMLVKGPARVTSREDTAKLLDNAGGTAVTMKVSIENQIKGGQYDVRQIGPDEVKIIAKQVFDQNIDQGVSSAIANPNSKSAKSMRSSYNVSRNLNGN